MAIDIDKSGYLRTWDGMINGSLVVLSFIGGIVNIFSWGYTGLLGFCFWSTFFTFLVNVLLHVFQVYDGVVARFTFAFKVECIYVLVLIALYLLALILSIVSFGVSNILGYFVLGVLVGDAFRRYRIHKSGGGGGGQPASPPENIEQA